MSEMTMGPHPAGMSSEPAKADTSITLPEHERHSAQHAKRIEKKIKHLKKGMKMSNIIDPNIFTSGLGGNGAGFGGGTALGAAAGGFIGAAIGRNGGLFGNNGDGNGAETRIENSVFNNTVLSQLADAKAAIPLAEAQVQLALAGVQAELTSTANVNAVANAIQIAGVKDAVVNSAALNLAATKDSQYATATAIAASENRIIATITANEVANLQRQLAVAESRGVEDRSAARSREVEVNVTQSVNQNQSNLMAQQQSQSQFQILANLAASVSSLANDVQTIRQGQTIFNSGTMAASGTQSAANTKV